MFWQNIKSWCKNYGYKADRAKVEDSDSYLYKWSKIDDPQICGETTSVSKLAKTIFNLITDNKYIEHQEQFQLKKQEQDILITNEMRT